MEKRGIDISHHQGEIDFSRLKNHIDFAMVRTSYGAFYEDRKYKINIKEIIYYLITIVTLVLSSMIGINFKKQKK